MRPRDGVTTAAQTAADWRWNAPSEPDQIELVAAARTGDQDAWELLYRDVHPRLRSYISRRVGAEHVEPAMSETMSRAVAGLDDVALGPSGFDGWLFGIARRVAFAHNDGATTAEPGDPPATPDEHGFVRRQFARLSPVEQELLELRVVACLSADEVALALSKRSGAVRTAQTRALAKLRRLMEGEDRRSGDD